MKSQPVSDEANQKLLATTLQKQKQEIIRQKSTPINLQKKAIKEEVKYNKKKLLAACKAKSDEEAQKYIAKLIQLRAKQIPLFIQEQKNFDESQREKILKQQIEKYYKDCYQLISSTQLLLASQNGKI